MAPKVKVLFLAASPTDQARLALDEEFRAITHELRLSDGRDRLELIWAWAVRPADLQRELNRHNPHIVHFSGHGSPDEEIILAGDNGTSRPLSKEVLHKLLTAHQKEAHPRVRLVVLNA